MTGKLAVVFGGSGFVGRNVVRELARRGWRVRVAVRRPHLAQFLRPMGSVGQIQLKQANIRHRPSVAAALSGADAVVNLVGLLYQDGAQQFDTVQAAGAAILAQLAADAGVENFVHMSAIGADAESGSLYARTKGQAEMSVKAAVSTATIVRPSIVFGQEDAFFNKFASMAQLSPILPLIGGGRTKFQPIYVDDIAETVCEILERQEMRGKVFEIGGPKVYTFKELMELMLDQTGRKRYLVPVPFPVAAIMGLIGEAIGRLPFVTPLLTRDQIKLLKHDNIVGEGEAGVAELGIVPHTLESILPTYMTPYRKYGQFAERAA